MSLEDGAEERRRGFGFGAGDVKAREACLEILKQRPISVET